jgi:glucoside 3-dehydrogenase (cytochrome c) hitch-hiker subunit
MALKILGTVGATCAFPFGADELYGQHVHDVLLQIRGSAPYTPAFFTPVEYATLSRLTDVIIPATDTPGATGAGVPEYIDRVVSVNKEHQPVIRAGLTWLEQQARVRFSQEFVALTESQHVTILQPLADEVDREQRELLSQRFRTTAGKRVYYVPLTDKTPPLSPQPAGATTGVSDPGVPVKFFRLIKNLTADGYYTSRVGLLEELGYTGNTMLATFPGCSVREQ